MNFSLVFNRLLILLAFVIPISIAAYNIVLGLITITWLLEGKWKEKWDRIRNQPVFKIMLIYFGFVVFSLLWTENLSSGWHYVKQYYIFFALPIIYSSINRAYIPQILSAFLGAMIVSEIFSYLIYFDLMPFKLKPTWSPSDPSPFMMHSIYSLFLVFSIFLMIIRIAYEKRTHLQTIIYVFFIVTMTLNLFLNSGRTGQFAFFLALIVFIYLYYQLHWIKSLLLGLLISTLVFSISYLISPNFQNRTNETVQSILHAYDKQEAKNDSTGQRFMMCQVASDIIWKNPLIGVGIGDERDHYHQTLDHCLPELKPYIYGFTDLHNTYLKVFASTGIIGLGLFLWVFYMMFKNLDGHYEIKTIGGVMLILLLQFMFIGNLPASHLTILFLFIMSFTLKYPHQLKTGNQV